MTALALHCGSKQVTRQMVEAVPIPAHTSSWRPVPYGDSIDFLHGVVDNILALPIRSEAYGLNKNGDQMFGLITLKTDSEESGLSIGVRGSYNKSLANAVACGANVFVCDNLCFSGDAFKVVRKNTVNVWADFQQLVVAQVKQSLGYYEDLQVDVKKLKAVPCDTRTGYSFLGVLLGENVMTPTQASVAFGDWKTPRYAEFEDRNLWGLYNAVTEGLKKGAPALILDRHAKAHDFFMAVAA